MQRFAAMVRHSEKTYMKTLLVVAIASLFFFSACKKDGVNKQTQNTIATGNWRLVQEQNSIASVSIRLITPSQDSAVTLALNTDGGYTTTLNGSLVAKGSYSVSADSSFFGRQLQLNNFTTTGIFNLFTLTQLGAYGQVIKSTDYFFIKISGDTLQLSTPLTPGGNIGYTFVKQ